MIAYLSRLPRWAKKKSVWHQRAAAVSLIHSTRQHKNFDHIQRITELLLPSDDDMVQKGLGWLLREAAKANPEQTVAYLMTIRDRTPRLVRTPANAAGHAWRRSKLRHGSRIDTDLQEEPWIRASVVKRERNYSH